MNERALERMNKERRRDGKRERKLRERERERERERIHSIGRPNQQQQQKNDFLEKPTHISLL